jgi:hypothetical protein
MNEKTKLVILSFVCVFLIGSDCRVQGEGNKENQDLKAKITETIHYGSLAPSSHNAQMWKIKMVAENKLQVQMDQQHILPQVDPENREAFISLGAFIENMVEAAPTFGLQPEVTLLDQSPNDPEVAEITFYPKAPVSTNLPSVNTLDNIKNRHTIRTPYIRKPLSDQDAKWIQTLGPQYHYFALKTPSGDYIQEAIIQATKQQVANDKTQKELAGFMRFSKKEAEKEKDGLTPEGMGLSGIAKWFVSTFFTQKTVMSKSFRSQTVTTATKQVENCSGFVVIASDDNSVTSLINSGRSLERFLITATGKKLAVHPMSAPLEETPWKETFSKKLAIPGRCQMILRVGYVKDYGHPVSLRRPVPISK